ncbi:hypothetical protein DRQ15_08720 [candidate division KSB1 bacterium]|nr:MAG: hypothetical protein DRQ15_08720 [candidate division KSB1 bacterium]
MGGRIMAEKRKTSVNYLSAYLSDHKPSKHWAYGVLYPHSTRIVGLESEDAIKSPQATFSYERYDTPALAQLRERYDLDSVVSGANSQFEEFVLLNEWVYNKIPGGDPEPDVPWDSLSILEDIEKGKKFFCVHYALVFVQCALALGYQGRMVQIWEEEKGLSGHSVAEVWSDEFNKWIAFDPSGNFHYEKNGVPLGALEIHKVWLSGDFEGLKEVPKMPPDGRGLSHAGKPYSELFKDGGPKHTGMYFHLRIIMRNDWFSRSWGEVSDPQGLNPEVPPYLHSRDTLHWTDDRTPPLANHQNTSVEREFNWPINFVRLWFDMKWPLRLLDVHMTSQMPNHRDFMVRLNGAEWQKKPEHFEWELKDGDNKIEVKPVNHWGREGTTTEVILHFDKEEAEVERRSY